MGEITILLDLADNSITTLIKLSQIVSRGVSEKKLKNNLRKKVFLKIFFAD